MNNLPPNFNLTKSVVDSIFDGVSRAVAPRLSPQATSQLGKNKKRKLEITMRDQFTNRSFEQASGSSSSSRMPIIIPKVEIPPIIRLKSGVEIKLNGDNAIFQTSNVKLFSAKLLKASNLWHLVIVHHFGRVSKKNILYRLNELARGNLFAAYCYTEGINFDFFLVYNQDAFLLELIENYLRVNIELEEIPLELRVEVGVVMPTHPKLGTRITTVLRERIHNAALYGGDDVYNLSSFSSLMSAHDIDVSLSNKKFSETVFNQFNGIEALKEKFHVFKFARNNISSLESFQKLFGFTVSEPWRILDLSENNLDSVDAFNDLKHLKIEVLILRGNEVTKVPLYKERIRDILPCLSAIDPGEINSAQGLTIPPAPILKLQVDPPKKEPKPIPKVKYRNGAANGSIEQLEEGVLIRRDATKRGQDPQWTHLRDSFQSYRNDSMWTQVIVQHGGLFNPQEIIDEMVASILNSNPFFPCFYKHFVEHDEFFLFKNFDALYNLMKNDLELIMPNKKKITFTLRLNAATFVEGHTNWYQKINYVISKRIQKDKTLNLDDFSNDPEFSKMKVPINSKFTLSFILDSAKRQNSGITKITACNNQISSFEFLQPLISYTHLSILDLRNNKIRTLEGTYSKSLTITELLLDGNPICERLGNSQSYVAEVKKNFAALECLDGCRIDKMLDLVPLQNYFVKRDAYYFAEEFVKTFIPLYDSFERHRLLEMYTDKSLFTLSFHYHYTRDIGHENVYSRIQKYLGYARNLGLMSDLSKSSDNVMVGKKNIAKLFADMPKTNHDMANLCVEVLLYDPNGLIIIKLSGVFEEQGESLNGPTLNMGYARTFVISPVANNQFVILNDQLFVHKAQAIVQKSRPVEDSMLKEYCSDILPTESEEHKLKLVLFKELTELKEEVCLRHLAESFWNIKVALATFNTLMDSRSIEDCDFNFM